MPPAPDLTDQLRALLREEIAGPIAELRSFVDRRIAELSAEVCATSELMDMSESKLSGMIAGIRAEVCSLIAAPAAATANSGLELEAVVHATESAANRILEAAEAISDSLRASSKTSPDFVRGIEDQVNAIFEACSFQDLTGQRIRRAIQHLQHVESELRGLGDGADMPSITFAEAGPQSPGGTGADLAQLEIDRLLNG